MLSCNDIYFNILHISLNKNIIIYYILQKKKLQSNNYILNEQK